MIQKTNSHSFPSNQSFQTLNPIECQAVFTNEWDLGSLAYSQETEGPYHTNLPTPEEIHQFLQFQLMRPIALKQTRRPQSGRGKARHSVSSTFAHHNRGSSSRQGDDDEDDGVSRASTPSSTTFLNSLEPLNYQQYQIPSLSQQSDDLLFE
ncbi:hypothetical protein Tco_1294239 [Tanacetum coccineum]